MKTTSPNFTVLSLHIHNMCCSVMYRFTFLLDCMRRLYKDANSALCLWPFYEQQEALMHTLTCMEKVSHVSVTWSFPLTVGSNTKRWACSGPSLLHPLPHPLHLCSVLRSNMPPFVSSSRWKLRRKRARIGKHICDALSRHRAVWYWREMHYWKHQILPIQYLSSFFLLWLET